MEAAKYSILALAVCMLFFGGIVLVHAANDPTFAQSITEGTTSTFNEENYVEQSVFALAGNITWLDITSIGQTKSWAGYYGNITGSITLDDANNYTFYNWSSAEPRGQIYATLNTSITWASVGCFNFTADTADDSNETTMQTFYNIATDDVDGPMETYTTTDHPSFEVASRTMTGCPTTYIFQNDAAQSTNFVNVLLYDNTTGTKDTGWIYTTLIENKTAGSTSDSVCYNNELCDFQILVNEDGHGTDTATTEYYFWVEIL